MSDYQISIQPAAAIKLTLQPAQEISLALSVGQGPAGAPGSTGNESMPYAKRTDFVGDDVIYKGEAEPGSSESDAVWRISKITFVDEDATEQWAEGNASFDKTWSSRLNYNYY